MSLDLRGLIADTSWLDTHEHLPDEALRLEPPTAGSGLHPCDDWAYLLWHYALDDLVSAGLTSQERRIFVSPDADPVRKWDAIAPTYARTRHSTYLRAARDSIRTLSGLEVGRDTVTEIDRRLAELRRPGFYGRVLDVAGVRACHVNSLQSTFRESADPDRLQLDIGLTDFVHPTPASVAEWETVTGHAVATMTDLIAVMAEYFTRFGPRASAVKLGVAYARPLAISSSPQAVADDVFRDWLTGVPVPMAQVRAIEDAVIDAGLGMATDQRLAVKVHTGFHVGTDRMDLRQVRDNVGDVAALARRFPTTFVLMHIGYPYVGEVIAAVKHHTNVVADMCWAWIIDPIGSRHFLKRFLVSAPASKVLCFGGDYIPVENIVGHAAIARHELARTLEELRDEGYLDDGEAQELVPELMHGNAERVFLGQKAGTLAGSRGG